MLYYLILSGVWARNIIPFPESNLPAGLVIKTQIVTNVDAVVKASQSRNPVLKDEIESQSFYATVF